MSDASLFTAVVIAVVVFIYVTIIRPAHQDQERHKQEMRNLRVGDTVLTTSNFIATVKDIQVQEKGPSRLRLELADGIIITALPGAVLERLNAQAADAASPQKGVSA